jgi:hypothetical protein
MSLATKKLPHQITDSNYSCTVSSRSERDERHLGAHALIGGVAYARLGGGPEPTTEMEKA